jgi:hypothetical protein
LFLELFRALNNILWSKKEEVTGDWRKIPNEELHYVYIPVVIWVIKSKRARWQRRVPNA